MASSCGSACPVPGGFYSYQPSISGNITFIVIHALLLLAALFLGRHYRKPWYSVLLSITYLLQIIAFVGRMLLHRARDSPAFFLIFFLGTLLAPLFASGTVFATLPSMIITGTREEKVSCNFAGWNLGILCLAMIMLGLDVAGAVLVCCGQRVLHVSCYSPADL
ncbi:hypothetical protein IF2G_07922 [Cordyceps javanica]|nr:hypothetical protein IF2G_07922 [Cordyceps javanica]